MNKKCSTMFLCCAIALGAQAADGTAKTDVLGRHVSSTQKVPKAYLKDIKKTTEQKAVIKNAGPQQQKALALTHYTNPPMITTSGVFEYKKNSAGNFEKLYKSYNLNKFNNLSLLGDSEDEDIIGDVKQFSNSYKQFLKAKRSQAK